MATATPTTADDRDRSELAFDLREIRDAVHRVAEPREQVQPALALGRVADR